MRRAAISAIVVAALMATSADASDFSQMGEPAFARMLLIRPVRQQEALCVGLADYRMRKGGALKFPDIEAMAEALASRLTEEIGDEKAARELVDARFGWFDAGAEDSEEVKKLKEEVADQIGGRCEPLFSTYQRGGAAAFAQALDPSEGLIPLLSMHRCIALAEYVSRIDPHSMFKERDLKDLHRLAREGLSGAERKQLDAAIAKERATLSELKPDAAQLGARPVACMATFRQRAVEAGRTSF